MFPNGFFTFLGLLFTLVVVLIMGMTCTLIFGFKPGGFIGGAVGAVLGWFMFLKKG